jgi:4-hydroxy-tetrahydrodipicolinate reductase
MREKTLSTGGVHGKGVRKRPGLSDKIFGVGCDPFVIESEMVWHEVEDQPDPELIQSLAEAGQRTVIIRSGNMSLGVNLLAALTRRVAATLGTEFDIEIVEMHHSRKVDAPSGTALLLGEAAAEGRGVDLDTHSARGRDGHTGSRRPGDIGFASLRGGSVVGEHVVIFAGPSERIELVHKAEDRGIFANGALTAARWGKGRAPGLYSMADVLDISAI